MSQNVIEVIDLSKQYRLGQVGTTTLSDDLTRWWYKLKGKEDPFLKVGEENDRSTKGESNYVWALKDLNFSVKKGEVLGIVGNNGAGKSTLLKILSRTTSPTTGLYRIKGRVASLLEVGTGFHPDLTGRENVFLNGAILGMTKAEIKTNFDEIVAFSGVERYIDTPVKRYSSGMYVRLAFAVAAHLNPDILIVDEVLAVGDLDFQKKCLGKMKAVSNQGRTVLFVSHNLSAVKSLCSQVAFIDKGKLAEIGDTEKIINSYLNNNQQDSSLRRLFNEENEFENEEFKLLEYWVLPSNGRENIFVDSPLKIGFKFRIKKQLFSFYTGVHVNDLYEECAFITTEIPGPIGEGDYESSFEIPSHFLNDRTYVIDAYFVKNGNDIVMVAKKLIKFEVNDVQRLEGQFMGEYIGSVRPKLNWKTTKINT
ncbi:MAG: ABC transporter ATP-binding protein [bacterium]|nr:ABC transporter ATP-binding protein [bacterium]